MFQHRPFFRGEVFRLQPERIYVIATLPSALLPPRFSLFRQVAPLSARFSLLCFVLLLWGGWYFTVCARAEMGAFPTSKKGGEKLRNSTIACLYIKSYNDTYASDNGAEI